MTKLVPVVLTMMVSICSGTTIIGVLQSNEFVVAADSWVAVKGGQKAGTNLIRSKLIQVGNSIFAVNSVSKQEGVFDIERITGDHLKKSASLAEASTNIEVEIKGRMSKWIAGLDLKQHPQLSSQVAKGEPVSGVLLSGVENGRAIVIHLNFKAARTSDGKYAITTERFTCPGDCSIPYLVFIGATNAKARFIEHGRRILDPPRDAEALVQVEIDAKTPDVGAPIRVLRLDELGVHWIK